MKTLISIIAMLFFLSFSYMSFAQIDLEKKVTKKVIKRVDKEIDKTIDEALDETEDAIKKSGSDKEGKEDQKTDTTGSETGTNAETKSSQVPQDDQSKKELKPWSKYDFVSGDKIIFEDNLMNEKHGEFPSKWNMKYGNAEIAKFGEENVIAFVKNKTEISPLMKTANYLPEIFTIEIDIYIYNKYNEAYNLNLKNQKQIDIRTNRVSMGNFEGEPDVSSKGTGWHHIALSFNQRALKVYFDQTRVLNIPNLEKKPTEMSISALSHGSAKGDPAMIRNIRIAEGGVELYDRLLTDGKIVTRGIHFDVGKATIKLESMGVINEIGSLMKKHPEVNFSVEGHTDGDGDESSNQKLSEARAFSVKNALVELGIDASRLETKGFGESKPVSDNTTPEGKTNNRRVEFVKI